MKITLNNIENELFNHIHNGIDSLYAQSESEPPITLATAGAYGSPDTGWHCHHKPVIGDWKTVDDVLAAYGIEVVE